MPAMFSYTVVWKDEEQHVQAYEEFHSLDDVIENVRECFTDILPGDTVKIIIG